MFKLMNRSSALPPRRTSAVLLAALLVGLSHLTLFCSKHDDVAPKDTLIARIGDKTISLDEFIRRAEYTIRPPYCRDDDALHKKIILNSLIAEKLLALEAGERNELTRSEEYQLYLRGRKEQAMRQWLYHQQAYAKVVLRPDEVKKYYQIASRKYRVAYVAFKDSSHARTLRNQLQAGGRSFEDLFHETGSLAGIPQREVTWDSPEPGMVRDAMFSEALHKDQVIGPLQVGENDYLVMKVLGWTESVEIADTRIQSQWQAVSERLTQERAQALFEAHVADLMRGKRVDFVPATFWNLARVVTPYYLESIASQEAAFNREVWHKDENADRLKKMNADLDPLLDAPLLRLDSEIWKVRDLDREMKIHPLVFRKKRLQASELPEQFKLAIVDMIRDRQITRDAYEKGYDEAEAVKQNVEMWRDNLLFLFQQNRYLESIGKRAAFGKDYTTIVEKDLAPYVDSLQAKYSGRIEINAAAIDRIQLTHVDMLVMQRNVPFPIVVPAFPVITMDHALDYGRNLK